MNLDVRPTWLDRTFGWIAPRTALRRIEARVHLAAALRSFEGASRTGRTRGWNTAGQVATSPNELDLATLRARSRSLTRNNGWAKQALRVVTNNVVGTGIVPRLTGDQGRRQQVEALWKAWGVNSKECDSRGRRTIYGLQRLAMRTVAEAGECLVRRRWRRTEDGLALPMQLELLEPDYLDTSKDGPTAGGGEIVQGIEHDALDRVRGYWLFRRHPGDMRRFRDLESRFVPASEIIHVFDEERAGQARGVPFAHAAIIRLRDFDELEDAELLRAKIAACFVALVHDMDASAVGDTDPETGEQIREKVEPGMLWKLPPGKDVKFGTPPVTNGFGDFGASMLRGVAAAYGITYEELTGDYSRVNFSSGRMGWLKADRNVRAWQADIMVAQFALAVWAWFSEAVELATGIETSDLAVSWDAPRREMLDPVKETEARVAGVRAGFSSLSDAIREAGRDPAQTLEELAQDADLLEQLELKLTTDPRNAAAAPGTSGAPPPGAANEDDDGEDEDAEASNPRTNGRANGYRVGALVP